MRALVALTLLSGCHALFGLDEVEDIKPKRDGGVDDADGDAPDAAPCDPNVDIPVPLLADTWFPDLATTAKGSDAVMQGLAGGHMLIAFRTQGYEVASATLTLTMATRSFACMPQMSFCTQCASASGDYDVYLSRTDWDELTATYDLRNATTMWNGPGATGGQDRDVSSKQTVTFDSTATVPQLLYTRSFLGPLPFTPGRIGFHIEGAAGAQAAFWAKGGVSCGVVAAAVPPQLTIRCR